MAQPLLSINMLIVGDEGVGKTNFVIRQSEKKFSKSNVPTLGVSYHNSTVTIDGEITLLEISDSSGKEFYRSLLPNFYINSDVVILMFDVTNRRSFDNLQIWNDDVKSYCFKEVITVVLANGKNLSQPRKISEKEGRKFASAIGATYFECFSENLSDVKNIFESIVFNLRKTWSSMPGLTMVPLYTPPNNYSIIIKKPKLCSKSTMGYDWTCGINLLQLTDKQLKAAVNQLQSKCS